MTELRRFRAVLPLGVLIVAAAVAAFAIACWVADDGDPGVGSGGSAGTYWQFSSVAEAARAADLIVVGEVLGDPVDRSRDASDILAKDVEVEILQYLKGSGPERLAVSQAYEITTTFPVGVKQTNRSELYVALAPGHRYVLFLSPGADPAYWIPTAQPLGYEVVSDSLVSAGLGPSPAEWGLTTLGDLARKVEEELARPTAVPLSQPSGIR